MVSHFFCPSPWSNRKTASLFLPLADLCSRSPLLFAVGWLPSALRRKQPDCSPPVDAVGRHTEKGISPSHRAMVSRNGDHRDRSMGKRPELIRHCPWFSCTCQHRRRPKARSADNISCICADSARECHQWPPRRAGNCSKGRE